MVTEMVTHGGILSKIFKERLDFFNLSKYYSEDLQYYFDTIFSAVFIFLSSYNLTEISYYLLDVIRNT